MQQIISQAKAGWGRLGMRFDGTISFGSIINLLVMIGGGMVFLLNYEHRMTLLEASQVQQAIHMADQDSQLRQIQQQLINQRLRLPNEFSTTVPPQ